MERQTVTVAAGPNVRDGHDAAAIHGPVHGSAGPFGRAVLLADGVFCVALGAGVVAGAGSLVSFLDAGNRPLVVGFGAVFAGWGASILAGARSEPAPRWLVKLVLAANLAWVSASGLLLATGVLGLSAGGGWAVGGLAVVVALFAALFWRSLRRG
jgi:hypothetical protein